MRFPLLAFVLAGFEAFDFVLAVVLAVVLAALRGSLVTVGMGDRLSAGADPGDADFGRWTP